MAFREAILSTTHIDSHNEVMALEALHSAKEQISQCYIPMGVEHDPRRPPIGRIVAADVKPLEDGHHALVGTVELFEPGTPLPEYDASKSMVYHDVPEQELCIDFDRSYSDPESQSDLEALGNLTGSRIREYSKKALEPLSVLVIGGAFILGGIAAGFLNKLGSDAFDGTKALIKKLLDRRKNDARERLIEFVAVVKKGERRFEVYVLITNPDDHDIDLFLSNGLAVLDDILPEYIDSHPYLRRLVFEYKNATIAFKFAVRDDAVPMFPLPMDGAKDCTSDGAGN